MCGITGIWRTDGRPADAGALARATQTIAHRGPDDFGFGSVDSFGVLHRSRDAGALPPASLLLGHRRLSILDLSTAGWQPMATPDGKHVIIFNGEIYNYLELGQELEREGVVFQSHGDTEVLLHALARWGKAALPRLIGMFAFAHVDVARRRIFLARDPFGIKPLYLSSRDGTVAFASEMKALLEMPHVRRTINADRLHAFLRSGLTDVSSDTLFADIAQLAPGHFVDVAIDRNEPVTPVRYWRVDLSRAYEGTFADAAATLRELFLDEVRLHLRSDVPVGAALSGGVDSSAIVAAMRHVEPALELHTFTFVADDPAISEEHWANAAGAVAGAVMHRVTPSAADLVEDLDLLIASQDEPFGSTSIYAQYRVCRLARDAGIKVMLDGQGADEMLGGYPYFMAGRLGALVRRGRLLEAQRFYGRARRMPSVNTRTLLANTGDVLFPASLRPMVKTLLQTKRAMANDWVNEAWFVERGIQPAPLPRQRTQSLLREQLAFSLEFGLPTLLRHEDRNSMVHSIESRVPFLTPRLAEFLFSLPDDFVISRDGESKSIFRAAMRGIVPDLILDRRDKIGFQTPEQQWLATLRPWVETVLGSEAAHVVPAFNHAQVMTEWRRIADGRQAFDRRIWRSINLVRWVELTGAVFE